MMLQMLRINNYRQKPILIKEQKKKPISLIIYLIVSFAITYVNLQKIDGILDAKTKLLDQFDATNVAKNKAAGIEPPVPITSLQQLLSAVIQPKIAAITSKFGALSGSSAGGLGGLSGGLSGGGAVPIPGSETDDSDDHAELSDDGAPIASGGSGNIISSFLKLSGPILSSSSAGAKGGQLVPIEDSSDE